MCGMLLCLATKSENIVEPTFAAATASGFWGYVSTSFTNLETSSD